MTSKLIDCVITVKNEVETTKTCDINITDLYNTIDKKLSLDEKLIRYEVLKNNNVKAYIDYDEYCDDWKTKRINVIKTLMDGTNKFLTGHDHKYYIMDSSGIKNEKGFISLRLIIPDLIYSCGLDMKADMLKINPDIDLTVYKKRDKMQLIRMPYCSKEKGNRMFSLVNLEKIDDNVVEKVPFKDITPELYAELCITNAGEVNMEPPVYEPEEEKPKTKKAETAKPESKKAEAKKDDSKIKHDTLKEILNGLSKNRFEHYEPWANLCWCVNTIDKANGFNTLDVLLELSRKSSKYKNDEYIIKRYNDGDGQFRLGSLWFWLKEDNPELFNKLKGGKKKDIKLKLLNSPMTDGDVVDYFVEIYKGEYTYYSNDLYNFNGIYWENDADATVFKNFDIIYIDLLEYLKKFIDDDDRDFYNNSIKKILLLRNFKKCETYLKKIKLSFKVKDDLFDLKPDLLGFKNGVYDLLNNEFRDGRKDDYITKIIPYDYEANVDTSKCLEFITKIIPDEEERNCLLKVLSSGLRGETLNNFIILTGIGRNGKDTLITYLLKATLGKDFMYEGNNCIITDKWKNGPQPELANFDKKRCVFFNEVNSDESVRIANIKKITGGDTATARKCFSNETENVLHGTFMMLCNGIPLLDKIDKAVIERLLVFHFKSLFIKKENFGDYPADAAIYEVNRYYQRQEFLDEYKLPFFHILLGAYEKFKEDGYTIKNVPESIKKNNIKYLSDSDKFYNWFISCYELGDDNNFVKIADVFNNFKISEYYVNLTKIEKRKCNKKNFTEDIEKSERLRMYYKERHLYYIDKERKESRNVILKWKKIIENDDDVVKEDKSEFAASDEE